MPSQSWNAISATNTMSTTADRPSGARTDSGQVVRGGVVASRVAEVVEQPSAGRQPASEQDITSGERKAAQQCENNAEPEPGERTAAGPAGRPRRPPAARLLLLLPADFRAAYGEPAVQTVLDMCSAA